MKGKSRQQSFRGQGAMEYLMNYSWALLVVMAIGLAFWSLGVFHQDQGGFTAIGFTYFNVLKGISSTEDGHTILFLQNRQPKTITLDFVNSSFTNEMTGRACRLGITPATVPPGEIFKVETRCLSPNELYYAMNVTLKFKTSSAGAATEGEAIGRISGKQEHIRVGPSGAVDCQGADINQDGTVDFLDYLSMKDYFGLTNCQLSNWCNNSDLNWDTTVDGADLNLLLVQFGNTCI